MPYKTWLLTGVLLLLPWVADAAGLGKLTILSALGRPLLAEVELVSVQKEELATLTARLASPEAFTRANVQYSPALVGVRVSIERRADGRPYIKIVSTRMVNEPFIDLLVELNWAQGRLVREYTALIDPPGYTPGEPIGQVAPPAVAAPGVAPESQPVVQAAPPAPAAPSESHEIAPTAPRFAAPVKPAARAPAAMLPAAPAKAESKEYGPVKRGDTLAKIAARVKPEGVTLEQMLVSLYHANPDAFAGNMNILKAGKILRVPEKVHVIETGQSEAAKEIRVEATNWNAYRQTLAEAVGETRALESRSAASGKITTAVDDKAAGKEAPKEVLKLSKGEPTAPGKAAKDAPRKPADSVRMLEEETAAREKALAEANDRIAHLEKTIQNLQRLLEIKGQVPGAPAAKPTSQPAPEVKPGATPPVKGDQAAKAEPAKAEPAKVEAAKDTAKALAEAPKDIQKVAPAAQPATEPPQREVPKVEAPKAQPSAQVQPKPTPKPSEIVQAPPDLVDQIFEEPLYLAVGAGLIALLGGAGYWYARRRRTTQLEDDEDLPKKAAPKLGKGAALPPAMAVEPLLGAPAGAGDDVDPLAEADLYLNFGRDEQAEEVLKEALEKNPKHEEAQLKLLHIYAARKDKTAFEKIARNLNTQTLGTGDNWLKAAAMGYAFDPGNRLYEAGKSAPAAAMPAARGAATGNDFDFNFELSHAPSEAAVNVSAGAAGKSMLKDSNGITHAAEAQVVTQGAGAVRVAAEVATAAAIPEFAFEIPESTQPPKATDRTSEAPRVKPAERSGEANARDDSAAAKADMIDFEIIAPPPPAPAPAAATTGDTTAGMTGTIEFYSHAAPPPVQAPVSAVAGDLAVPMADMIDFDAAALTAPEPPAAEGKDDTHDDNVTPSPETHEDHAAGFGMDFELADTTGVSAVPHAKPEAAKPAGATNVFPDFKSDLGGDLAPPLAPEFKLGDINLDLDNSSKTVAPKAPGPEDAAKDDRWYDVQTKFDLAKAYQEMGDKDGALEVLQEVIKEGNAEQQAEAVKLRDSLSA